MHCAAGDVFTTPWFCLLVGLAFLCELNNSVEGRLGVGLPGPSVIIYIEHHHGNRPRDDAAGLGQEAEKAEDGQGG